LVCGRAEWIPVGDQLFEEWQVYEKLLIHDYMDHRAFFARLQAEVQGRFQRPPAILDLGCGDLTPILPMLAQVPLQRYVGIDESDVALAIAAGRLEELGQPSRLISGDLVAVLDDISGPFDVVLASFSLHHLADPGDKLMALKRARRLLTEDGFFAMIDVLCAEAEPRERYVERWIANAESRYLELRPAEKALLFDHVRARDFPLSLNTWRALGFKAGLPRVDVLLEDRERLNRLVTFAP
jgi:ubiquinone/menaquinone biosynthesis C-methylase UbiE